MIQFPAQRETYGSSLMTKLQSDHKTNLKANQSASSDSWTDAELQPPADSSISQWTKNKTGTFFNY